MTAVLVDVHPLEPPRAFHSSSATRGPVVADSARGQWLGWIYETLQTPPPSDLPKCRPARPADFKTHLERRLFAVEVLQRGRQLQQQEGLPLQLLDCHQSLDGAWLVLYFSAPQRVDFRPLVLALGRHYSKKIEMFQVKERQRVQLSQQGTGRCGQTCCCHHWLREFPTVTIKIAEEQGFQLQPEAITGVCGRLLCCLRYEYEALLESFQELQVGDSLEGNPGPLRVLEKNPHTRTLKVRDEQGREWWLPFGQAKKSSVCRSCQKGTTDPLE